MNKLFLFIAVIVGFLSVSCRHDDEPDTIIEGGLPRSLWRGNDVCYENGQEIASVPFIAEFLPQKAGRYIFIDEDGNPNGEDSFTYSIDGDMITFNGAIVGNWTILERTENTIILRAFLPKEHKMSLCRIIL